MFQADREKIYGVYSSASKGIFQNYHVNYIQAGLLPVYLLRLCDGVEAGGWRPRGGETSSEGAHDRLEEARQPPGVG